MLTTLLLGTIDFARLFYHYSTITTCARNGALYACDATGSADSQYANYQQAAIADGASLNPPLTVSNVSMTSGTDAAGAYVAVTVTYDYKMVTTYLFGTNTVTLSRTVRMLVEPATPN
jgi:hypothetical protein